MAALRLFLALLASLLLLVAIFVGIIRSGEPPGTPQAQPRAHQEGLRGMWLPQRSPGLHQTKAHGALRLSPDQAPQSKEALHSMQSPHSKQALLSKAPNSAVLHSAASNERLPVAGGSHCTRGCTRKTFLGSLLQGLRASLATAASSRSLLGVSLRAPYKGCTVSFKNKKRSFSRCTTLDSARKFRLAWTLNKKTGVALTWFEGPPDKAYGWVSWGISPSGKMQNSDVIVAYGNPLQTAKARVRPYFLAGVKPEQCKVDVTIGFLEPVKGTLAVEVVNKGRLIRISASVKALDIPGEKAVIWRGGPGVTKAGFNSGLLPAHKDNKKAVKFIDFNK